ncbi:hypothetical protein D037_3892B, partial [Vibrio parahaemolyticus IDH02640]
VDALARIG